MMSLFVEIIVYRLKAGSGSVFHETMLNESLPLHRSVGIRVIDSRQSATDPDCYCLVRAFGNLAAVQSRQEEFYASAAWREGPRQRIVDCIETVSKVVLEMTESQVAAWEMQDRF
jgi:hypothetical protein